jgi:hypothetical protein
MHPNELKNLAFAAAARAELDGFTATAEALKLIAVTSAEEARPTLEPKALVQTGQGVSVQDRAYNFDFSGQRNLHQVAL